MTYREFLAARASELGGSDTPFLDASLILSKCLLLRREELLARLPEALPALPDSFSTLWARRLSGEPIAYILGSKEFYGRVFEVDRRVLIPRPDTETLVLAALETGDRLKAESGLRVHDVCTGSGVVAVTLAAERPSWKISASDISAEALEVAQRNVALHASGKVVLVEADLLAEIPGGIDVITANPPYVPSHETTSLLSQGWGEPRTALDGGPDGLDFIRSLALQAGSVLASGGYILIEMDPSQIGSARDIFSTEGYKEFQVWKDLAGKERVFRARRFG